MNDAFALAGRALSLHHTQGVALGYELLPLQGEALNTEMRRHGGVRHGGVEIRRKILCFRRYGEFFRTP